MHKSPHDIYGTTHNERNQNALYNGSRRMKEFPGKELWVRHRRQSTLFGIVALLCAMLLILVVIQQYRLSISPSFDPAPERRAVPVTEPQAASAYLDFSVDRHTAFLMDELQEPDMLSENPNARDMPLESAWVKKAAYHLIQAEMNEREGLEDRARGHYENALRIFPDLRGVHQKLGIIYLRREAYDQAAAAFEEAALEDASSHGIVNNLGVAYMNLDRREEAEESFLRAIQLNPEYAPAHYNLAHLYMRMNDMERAAASFHQFMELEPAQMEAALTYAYVLIQLKEWQAAADLLTQISRVAPESPSVHFRLAQSLSHTGDRGGAVTRLSLFAG